MLITCEACLLASLPIRSQDSAEAARTRAVLASLRTSAAVFTAPAPGQIAALRRYLTFADSANLHALPAQREVLELYRLHRIAADNVDTPTTSLDLDAISAWHIDVITQTGHQHLTNPAKTAWLRYQGKQLERHLKKPSRATEKWTLRELVRMSDLCPNDAYGRHDRLCLEALSFGLLRKGAAASMRLRRTNPADPLSFDLHEDTGSDVAILHHPTLGAYVRMAVHRDKVVKPGQPRFVFIPQYTDCGIDFVATLSNYLIDFKVPDGFLFASPTGKLGNSFHSNSYTAWDKMAKRCYLRAFPSGAKRVASHSCRKSLIQIMFNMMDIPQDFLGDLTGWLSVKTSVLKYYASLSLEYCLAISSSLRDHTYDTTSTSSRH